MLKNKEIRDIRREYSKFSLDEATLTKDPFQQFKVWFDDALRGGFIDPNAMVLSTVSDEGMPSSRVVLLKGFDKRGFTFYTNYNSRKGKEIANNPKATLLFYWDKFERQVRISGEVSKITPEESFNYFKTRPYTSKIGAWSSKQSNELRSRFTLMRKVAVNMVKYPVSVPLPSFWGGLRLYPLTFEFWQGRESRLHDRFQYEREGDVWTTKRLYP